MNRGRIDIITDILNVCKEQQNKTRIVYKTNLNFNLTGKYLDLLKKNGLLERREKKYVITDKGRTFLEKPREISLHP